MSYRIIELPYLQVWQKPREQKTCVNNLASIMRWPNDEVTIGGEWFIFTILRALMITSKSPSKIMDERLRSWAKLKNFIAAIYSSATEWGKCIFSFVNAKPSPENFEEPPQSCFSWLLKHCTIKINFD